MLDYQRKSDCSLGSINAELPQLKTKFTEIESVCAISRNVNVKLVESLVVTEQKCWANELYSRRECLKTSAIPESVSHSAFKDKIQGVLRGIDGEVDTENIESCHRLKGKVNKGKVILKLSKRKDVDKIKLNKKKLKILTIKIGLSSRTKVFINESLCGCYKLIWSKCKKLFLEKEIASFCVTNGTAKIKLLNDQVRSIINEVDLSPFTHEGPLDVTDRNE